MDGNGNPIQVIIFFRNDMILEEKQTKAPFGAVGSLEPVGEREMGESFLSYFFPPKSNNLILKNPYLA